jgi:predicted membrane protein
MSYLKIFMLFVNDLTNKFLEYINKSQTASWILLLSVTLLIAYGMLFYLFYVFITFVLLLLILKIKTDEETFNIFFIGFSLIFLISFMFSFGLSTLFDDSLISKTTIELKSPKYIVTKNYNNVVDKNNSFRVDDNEFSRLVFLKCKNVQKIKYIMNNKEFSDIYRYTKTKIYCTDNGVRNEIK